MKLLNRWKILEFRKNNELGKIKKSNKKYTIVQM